jgi:hypothetical protein
MGRVYTVNLKTWTCRCFRSNPAYEYMLLISTGFSLASEPGLDLRPCTRSPGIIAFCPIGKFDVEELTSKGPVTYGDACDTSGPLKALPLLALRRFDIQGLKVVSPGSLDRRGSPGLVVEATRESLESIGR